MAGMEGVSSSRWRVGAGIAVRGRRWQIEGVSTGDDCVALRLRDAGALDRRTLTILTPFDRPASLERAAAIAVVRPRRWRHELDRLLLDVCPCGSLRAMSRASVRVIPYQIEPALAMFRHGAMRVLIADAVGLGKTIQAGLILQELLSQDDASRALILVPAGLREQWSAELEAGFGIACANADRQWLRQVAAERPPDVNPWSLPGVYLASHDFVKRAEAFKPLEDMCWDLVIVDEAHAASRGTDRRAAIAAIAARAARVVLLTATPPADDPAEFTALCDVGRLGTEPPPAIFARTREDVDGAVARKSRLLYVRPSAAEARMHRLLAGYCSDVWREASARNDADARLVSIVLRKRALSSAASLAASIARRLELLRAGPQPETSQLPLPWTLDDEDPLPDDVPSTLLGAPGLADSRREWHWLTTVADAAQNAARAETKIRRLSRLVARLREPVIVFTEYRDTLARLREQLAATGRTVALLHGGMTPAERTLGQKRLGDDADVLLATDAAAEGLNLHRRCRVVVHFELPWNPSRLEQRAGRVDRIGQSRRVHEIALVAADTAERLVLARLLRRRVERHGLPGASRLLTTLSEARIVDAVMGSSAVDERPCQQSAWPPLERYIEEAVAEAKRIERARELIARSGRLRPAARGVDAFATTLAGRAGGGSGAARLLLFYSIEVGPVSGHPLHTDVLALEATCDSIALEPHRASVLRAIVRPAQSASDRRLRTALAGAEARALAHVARIRTAVHDPLGARIAAIVEARQSSASALVQAELFGERSNAPRRRHHPERSLFSGAPQVPSHHLRVGTGLAAALLTTGRR
jgi:superfamily II DNA or RNA helicase